MIFSASIHVQEKIKTEYEISASQPEFGLWHWYVGLQMITNRKRGFVLVNSLTGYTVCLENSTKPIIRNFSKCFQKALETSLSGKVSKEALENYFAKQPPLTFANPERDDLLEYTYNRAMTIFFMLRQDSWDNVMEAINKSDKNILGSQTSGSSSPALLMVKRLEKELG
ncbi:hypothetical protein FUAX_07330 [Fulvitalea axinellae]|uniref:DUF6933 domain-containing protein n=1 Tax=Fulvitalea axinellae TaxID=1182444 RepID=A0AAU9C871_9BACT|nr:hypothetical protein FUAX_07330 [Fulvitalea axinellae]